ncbi:MAG: InlB B-repeat-containing protein, partial [Acholeplasmatales bacterium]|nr:InlB B-repeat-containing protein [Acholeplasmatales bacterium]
DVNGGNETVDSQRIAKDQTATKPTVTLTKTEDEDFVYTFENKWYTTADCTEEFDFSTPITKATKVYAGWTKTAKYTVTFDLNGGTGTFASQTILSGNLATKPTGEPTKEDNNYLYEFVDWYKDSEAKVKFDFTTPITDNTIIYAGWDIAEEIVHIYIYEGEYGASDNLLIEVQTIIKGGYVREQLKTPYRRGYKFIDFHFSSSYDPDDIYPEEMEALADEDIFGEWEELDLNSVYNLTDEVSDLTNYSYYATGNDAQQANFYQSGYVTGKIGDFSQYENTSAYVKVYNADQLIKALENARLDYTSNYVLHTSTTLTAEEESALATLLSAREQLIADNKTTLTAITGNYTEEQLVQDLNELNTNRNNNNSTWKNENPFRMTLEDYVNRYVETTITQTLNNTQSVHVIEIMSDIDLGYYKLSATAKASSIVSSYSSKYDTQIANGSAEFYVSSMLSEYGISSITISKTNDLLVYSKNGAKLTHGGFKVTSCDRVVFRNLEMDEIWQWEDSASSSPSFTVGDMDVFGWKYFDIKFCGYIWIDHCTFGKAYDGIIDISNPYFYSYGTASSAPYGKPSEYTEDDFGGIHISNCYFRSGSDDPDGYLYKMMEEIEADYQLWVADNTYECKCLYYKTLRYNLKLSFEEILYGIAIPHKKAFLWGDSSESKKAATYHYNQYLKVSLANNIIVDIEDRLPNVRGGIAYMYNTVIDNSRYYKYRNILISAGIKNISTYNKKYKSGAVSQGILGGYGASIYAENCIFIGIDSLVKNNNDEYDDITTDQMASGFNLVNCIWYNDKDSSNYIRIINTIDNPNQITTSGDYPITTANFSWHNATNTKPFEPALYNLEELTSLLVESQHVGANSNYDSMYIYTAAIYNTIK